MTSTTAVGEAKLSRFTYTTEMTTLYDDFETVVVSESKATPHVLHVEINRPSKRNAMNAKFWVEFRECFERIAEDSDARVVIVSGAGTAFTHLSCRSCHT